jgi:hypothetical protein
MEVNIDVENRTHELWVQIQELKGELETLWQALSKVFQTTYIKFSITFGKCFA